jgi:phage shock protein A
MMTVMRKRMRRKLLEGREDPPKSIENSIEEYFHQQVYVKQNEVAAGERHAPAERQGQRSFEQKNGMKGPITLSKPSEKLERKIRAPRAQCKRASEDA